MFCSMHLHIGTSEMRQMSAFQMSQLRHITGQERSPIAAATVVRV
jgi:hypothetical protein